MLQAPGRAPAAALHVLDQAAHLQARSAIVITGHGATEVEAATAGFTGASRQFDLRIRAPGLTGHQPCRYNQPLPHLQGRWHGRGCCRAIMPLTQTDTLRALVAAERWRRLALLTVTCPTRATAIIAQRRRRRCKASSAPERHHDQRASPRSPPGGIVARATLTPAGAATDHNAGGGTTLTDNHRHGRGRRRAVVAHPHHRCAAGGGRGRGRLQLAELERAPATAPGPTP